MKKILALILAGGAIGSALAQPSVGVSIGINQPGVYGRINIGDVPPPALVLAQPVVIMPPPVVVRRSPIYLYVPPYQQQDWRRYCDRYGACGQPVYFVREDWVRERYVQAHPGWDRDHRWERERHDDRHDNRRDFRGDDHDDERGDGRDEGWEDLR